LTRAKPPTIHQVMLRHGGELHPLEREMMKGTKLERKWKVMSLYTIIYSYENRGYEPRGGP